MRLYRWCEDTRDHGFREVVVTRLDLRGLEDWSLRKGRHISEWHSQNVGYYVEDGFTPDLLCNATRVHVVSAKLQDLLACLNLSDVQFLPLLLRQEGGTATIKDYSVLNVERTVSCLDREQSVYGLWGDERLDRRPDQLRHLKKAVLIRSKVGKIKIFRLAEWTHYLVVNETIKNEIEEAGCTGNVFVPLELTI